MTTSEPEPAGSADDKTSRLSEDRGETAIGSVLLFPVLLFGLFMVIQIMLGVYTRAVVSAAASDAAALLAQEGATVAQAETYANDLITDQAGGLITTLNINSSKPAGGDFVTVTITGDTRLIWSNFSVGLDVSASAPIERFEPQAP